MCEHNQEGLTST